MLKLESFPASPASKHTCSTVPLCKTLENAFPCQQIASSRLKGFNFTAARYAIRVVPGRTGTLRDCSPPPPHWPSLPAPPTAAWRQKLMHFDVPQVYFRVTNSQTLYQFVIKIMQSLSWRKIIYFTFKTANQGILCASKYFVPPSETF